METHPICFCQSTVVSLQLWFAVLIFVVVSLDSECQFRLVDHKPLLLQYYVQSTSFKMNVKGSASVSSAFRSAFAQSVYFLPFQVTCLDFSCHRDKATWGINLFRKGYWSRRTIRLFGSNLQVTALLAFNFRFFLLLFLSFSPPEILWIHSSPLQSVLEKSSG